MDSTTYFSFAIAHSMLPDDCSVSKRVLVKEQEIKEAVLAIAKAGFISCVNPSRDAVNVAAKAIKERFGIEIEIPEKPLNTKSSGDSLAFQGDFLFGSGKRAIRLLISSD